MGKTGLLNDLLLGQGCSLLGLLGWGGHLQDNLLWLLGLHYNLVALHWEVCLLSLREYLARDAQSLTYAPTTHR
jgi:hypothetical protein